MIYRNEDGFLMNRRSLGILATTLAGLAIWPLAPDLPAFAQNRSAQQGPQKPLVLKGGLLIDGAGGAPLKDAVIVLSGGRIQSIGTQASAKIPAGATVIDTSGKTILPGLINSHVHMRNFLAPLFLYWGVTTIGDLGNPTGWMLAYRDEIAKGRIVGPSILAAGAKFDPPLKPGDPMVTGDLSGFSTFLLGNSARLCFG
jgi:hypothetical protein